MPLAPITAGKPTSGDLSVQRRKDRRVCSLNHPYRSVIELASLDSEWRDRAGFNGHPDLIPTVNLLMQCESRRQSCLKIDLFSGDGVVEFQKLSVQEISSMAREAGEIFKRLAG